MSFASSHGLIIEKREKIYDIIEQITPLFTERINGTSKLLYYEEESGLNFWLNLDGENFYFGYNTDLRREVLLTEYHRNYYNKEKSVIVCEDPEGNEYKLAVMMNDYYILPEYELPVNAEIKLYGVAFEDVDVYKNDADFDAVKNQTPMEGPDKKPILWGDKFIAPTGLMSEVNDRFEITDTWLIARVIDVNVKLNLITGNEFVVARCDTVGGEIDILFPSEFKDKLNINSIIDGVFVLRGEVLKAWEASEEIKELYK